MKKKNFLKLFASLALVFSLALLSACSSSPEEPAREETQQEAGQGQAEEISEEEVASEEGSEDTASSDKDTLHKLSTEVPYFLDPTQKMSGTYWKGVSAVETIMDVTAEGEVVPAFAESIDQEDENTWVFTIPEGAIFWSGTEVKADNLLECIERNRTDSPDGKLNIFLRSIGFEIFYYF